jgi:hypothetical protein
MKLMALFTVMFFSLSLHALTCENESYQRVIHDYSGGCLDLIGQVAKANGCNSEELDFLEKELKTEFFLAELGSTTFCKAESKSGHYVVASDDMSEPPVATVFYSKYD